jgi:hypothetical protein
MRTLTEYQLAVLERAANEGARLFVVMEAIDSDTGCQQARAALDVIEMAQLINEGLVLNVSENFADVIEETRKEFGRGCSVFAITNKGFAMFHHTNDTTVVN